MKFFWFFSLQKSLKESNENKRGKVCAFSGWYCPNDDYESIFHDTRRLHMLYYPSNEHKNVKKRFYQKNIPKLFFKIVVVHMRQNKKSQDNTFFCFSYEVKEVIWGKNKHISLIKYFLFLYQLRKKIKKINEFIKIRNYSVLVNKLKNIKF